MTWKWVWGSHGKRTSGHKVDGGALPRVTCGVFIHLEKDAILADIVLWIHCLVSSVQARFQPPFVPCAVNYSYHHTWQPSTIYWNKECWTSIGFMEELNFGKLNLRKLWHKWNCLGCSWVYGSGVHKHRKVFFEKYKSQVCAVWMQGLDINYLIRILIPNWEISSERLLSLCGLRKNKTSSGTLPSQDTGDSLEIMNISTWGKKN